MSDKSDLNKIPQYFDEKFLVAGMSKMRAHTVVKIFRQIVMRQKKLVFLQNTRHNFKHVYYDKLEEFSLSISTKISLVE